MTNVINHRFEKLCYDLYVPDEHLTTWFGKPSKKRVTEVISQINTLIQKAQKLNPTKWELPYYEFHFFEKLQRLNDRLRPYKEKVQTSKEKFKELEQSDVQIKGLYAELDDIQKETYKNPIGIVGLKSRLMTALNTINAIRPIMKDGIYSEAHLNGPYINSDKLQILRIHYLEMNHHLKQLTARVMKISEHVSRLQTAKKLPPSITAQVLVYLWNKLPRNPLSFLRRN